jgi:hypothetical protein
MHLVGIYQYDWKTIASLIHGKTPVAVKERFF